MKPELNKFYLYKEYEEQTDEEQTDETFYGVVKITEAEKGFGQRGDIITIFKNTADWRTHDVYLKTKSFIKEITQEENPEYFL